MRVVGEIHDGLVRLRLDEQLVPDRRRVDDQVSVARLRRPVAPAGEDPQLARKRRSERVGGAARPNQANALGLDPGHDLLVGVEAEDPAVAEGQRVH